ncbi:LamG-like jellyroll fold domain-containing protein [Cochleicola gelatinilyticus]|uniref:LamG-like jellyroll fold domain-containing protein n=1 Tax=Cochleicola gelatinilyticus TaxID=1763537 RepID=A0A167G7Z4_9FLAO|nr:LamG-like jellyroll fold domain-containing protein [Cochleicola gelatinilyticus]OAB77312.1 hypothetical protein ULVI_12475 [Cochleicola gelatinilyticus]
MKHLYFKSIVFLFFLIVGNISLHAQSNQYLHFDGVDDYTELENGAQYVTNSNTISMAGWFYTDALTYGQGMMSIRGGGTGSGEMYLIQLNNGTVECRVITTTGLHQVVAPEGTIQAGVWQHITWIFDQDTVELFVDGVSIGSSPASGMFEGTTRPFSIGKCIQPGFNFVFKGRADEVSLWSKALTVSEIQDMMENELVGDETDLQVYYKFNQGTPGGNNTTITQLLDQSGVSEKNSELRNFALIGETSNFGGDLEDGFQAIDFLPVPNKLISDPSFELEASVNSNLPITFEIVSGPATVSGNMVTLTGEAGEVTVKASQPGDDTWDPAEDVFVSFQVLDPAEVLVEAEILHPLYGDVFASSLIPLQVAIRADIAYPELFSIDEITVEIDGGFVELTDHGNGHYTGWWAPTGYQSFDIILGATNNYGELNEQIETITIVEQASNTTTMATDHVWVNGNVPTLTVEAELPSSIGAFDQISGTLVIDCPEGGCDPWDRVSSVEAQGKNGEWYEIIRYLTPYGVACQSDIDLTDFASLLLGKTKFRVNLGTQGNGFEYTLLLTYTAGVPEYAYSNVEKLWYQTYQFGDMANLQPTEHLGVTFSENTETAKVKLVSSGHGWGDNNTGNAAEFQANTHQITVDGNPAFEQYNWVDCNPNPDGCSPQSGTWYFDRAGWCPGSIAQFFDFDMQPYVQGDPITLRYVFDESYRDLCHPNNPDCESGTTCPNCNDGFNPHLIVSSYLISYGNSPTDVTLGQDDVIASNFSMYPNPSTGIFFVDIDERTTITSVQIHDYLGRIIKTVAVESGATNVKVNLQGNATGVYLVSLQNNSETVGTKKIIIE